jgi:prevent-host-death family protein
MGNPSALVNEAIETRVGADEARSKLGDLIDRAIDGERVVVTRHEKDRAVLLGMRDYQRYLELERAAKAAA